MTGRNKTYKTAEYKAFQNEVRDELEGTEWPFKDHRVSFYAEAGLSNQRADLDNIIKPLLDTLQNVYEEFNDCKVYHIELHKRIVKKTEEYIYIRVGFYQSGAVRIGAPDEAREAITETLQVDGTFKKQKT